MRLRRASRRVRLPIRGSSPAIDDSECPKQERANEKRACSEPSGEPANRYLRQADSYIRRPCASGGRVRAARIRRNVAANDVLFYRLQPDRADDEPDPRRLQ